MQKIGLEIANGFIKIVTSGTELVYPNKVKKLSGMEFNVLGELGVIYEYNNNRYILDDKGSSSGGRASNRYLTEDYLLEMLIAITQVITDRNVSLTIGMPCRDFGNVTLKKKMQDFLNGRHIINVVTGDNKEEYIINIVKLNIVCEPLGTLCDFVFNENLQIINKRNEFSYVIVDIGYSTTDILATNGLQIDKLAGDDIGCMDIVNEFVRSANAKFQDSDYHFTHSDVSNDLTPIIKKYGKEFDLTTELNEVKKTVANDLTAAIRRSGINLSHYDRIIYTGGGALALKDQIVLRTNEIIYPDAQLANARGFYKFSMIKG